MDSAKNLDTFCLKLRHGGCLKRNEIGYVGGATECLNLDIDLWGMITLRETVEDLGYNMLEKFKYFTSTRDGVLFELETDSDCWAICDIGQFPNLIEVWVVGEGQGEAEPLVEGDCQSDDDEEYDEGEYSDDDSGGSDDLDFEGHVDPNVEFAGLGKTVAVDSDEILTGAGYVNEGIGTEKGVEKGAGSGTKTVNDGVDFSDEDSGKDSDEDEQFKFPVFRPKSEMKSPKFSVGLTFGTKAEFKQAVHNYALNNGKDLKFTKNDKCRMCVRCRQEGCPFKINLWKVKNAMSWRIVTFNEEHVGCGWVFQNSMVKSTRIAKRWVQEIGHHTNWTTSEFRDKVKVDDKCEISTRQAYRAIKKAKKVIEGEAIEFFNKIWDYVLEIEKTNPNTTWKVKESDLKYEGRSRFLRMYFCWEACKEGYKFCRKIIGVDGCYLKSKFGGQLLTAVGIDGNDNIFPLAYAIVELETKESWSWFLELLRVDLKISREDEHQLIFISDKQKGLLPAFEDVLPYATHRFCVRHLHGNMKLAGFVGKALKDGLWAAAKATTVNSFNDAMGEIKNMDVEAYKWLAERHPSEWSRSHFTPFSKSDALVNNISESFNAMILDAREQPLISCLESIRKLLMKKLFESKQKAASWKGHFCLTIMKKIAVVEQFAAGCLGSQSDENLFEIRCMSGLGSLEQHSVDLMRGACSCRKWDLTGIPCKHAICAIWLKHGKGGVVHHYVSDCYSINSYLNTYGGRIKPLAGPSEWPKSNKQPLLPPLYTRKAGRPKKLRKMSAPEMTKDGTHMNRSVIVKHCKKCNKTGHNARTCPLDPTNSQRKLNPRKRKIKPKTATDKGDGSSTTVPTAVPTQTAPIQRQPNPRVRKQKQTCGTQPTARQSKLIPMKRKINQTTLNESVGGSNPVVPLGIGIDDTIGPDFWSEAVEVAAMFDNVAEPVVAEQEEISITQPEMELDTTQPESTPQVTKASKTSPVQPRRRYGTRSNLKSRFNNTVDSPLEIE
ncbi:uncharacterized protein LOC116031942 [Ipomoea triloba]|uniref:uncharacterized protein LOC116031942 n=1 Tax=Ipomoea triloba TaxID=35885 RepID=UPI00125D194E|nr:uncharacterized protein LOC116031942 [Ipomoea triloba]